VAAHARLNPAAKEATARYVSELWNLARLPEAASEDDDPLLEKARRWIEQNIEETSTLSDLVSRIQAARRDGDEAAAEQLREELIDLLYDLDDEGDE